MSNPIVPIVAEIEALADSADPVDLHGLAGNGDHQLPIVLLPGGATSITQAARALGRFLGETGRSFLRGGVVVTVEQHRDEAPILCTLRPASAASTFETVARLAKERKGKNKPATCSEANARLILAAEVFRAELPAIRVVSPCPVPIERNGELVQIQGYDAASGTLASGERVVEPPLDEARRRLSDLVNDFDFATPSDRSRALASIITPSLMRGGLLLARVPIDLGEADESQAGKGYRHKVTAAIYGDLVRTIVQRKGGVGGLVESFDAALIAGRNFISLDNVRGRIDLPAVESFLTEDVYLARVPYSGNVEIDPRPVVLMMTSNRAEMTTDLSNRASCVRIRKRPPGHAFRTFPEGDLLAHVRANQACYLAAVFAIIRAWHAAGKLRSNEARHDFRDWAQTLDWIVQHLLGENPLIDGHSEAQSRMAIPHLTWLRGVVLAVEKADRLAEQLRAHDILDILAGAEVEIPGLGADDDIEDEVTRQRALRGLGRRLATCFSNGDPVEIDGFRVERSQGTDSERRSTREYRISAMARLAPAMETAFPPSSAIPAMAEEPSLISGGRNGSIQSAGPHGGHGGHAEHGESRGRGLADDCEFPPPTSTPEERRLLSRCPGTTFAVSAARDDAARWIRNARRAGDDGLAVALRDAWRERLAICTVNGDLSMAEAERIAAAELRQMLEHAPVQAGAAECSAVRSSAAKGG